MFRTVLGIILPAVAKFHCLHRETTQFLPSMMVTNVKLFNPCKMLATVYWKHLV